MNLLLIALGIGLGGGNLYAEQELRRFEAKAAIDLREQLQGEGAVVSVDAQFNGPFGAFFSDLRRATLRASQFETDGLPLFTEPERPKDGILRELRIELSDFSLRGLRIDRLVASIPDCRFDRNLALRKRQIRLSQSGVGEGWVEILEKDLARYIPMRVREIKSCVVKLDRGKVWVEGYGEFLIAKTKFLVVADLQIEGGSRLNLANARVVFGWRKADDASRAVLLDAMNPVVDLDRDLRLYGAISLERIEIQGGRLRASGRARIPTRPSLRIR